MIDGHGNDAYRYRGIIGDFSSNIPYLNHADRLIDYLGGKLDAIKNYPDPYARRLRHLLSTHHGVEEEQILVTNGSAEAFYLLAQHFSGVRTLIPTPSFAEYEDATRLFQHKVEYLPWSQFLEQKAFAKDTIWLAIPNNPDGFLMSTSLLEEKMELSPATYWIVDLAYEHLTGSQQKVSVLHNRYPKLVTVHSLTKTFAMPGLRLGYLIASRELIQALDAYRTPWTVNALAQEAGCYILEHYQALLPDRELLLRESHLWQQRFALIPQLEVTPSETNYFLLRLAQGTASDLKEYLALEYGLLIRDASNFRGLSQQHFRISVQGEKLNQKLLEALIAYHNR